MKSYFIIVIWSGVVNEAIFLYLANGWHESVLQVKTGSLVAGAKLNATPNSVPAIWLFGNATPICARPAEQTSSTLRVLLVKTSAFSEAYVSFCVSLSNLGFF